MGGLLTDFYKTGDGVSWDDPKIDADKMNEMMRELIDWFSLNFTLLSFFIMPYSVKIEQHLSLFVEFETKKDFDNWVDCGSCISDLDPQIIIKEKINSDVSPIS